MNNGKIWINGMKEKMNNSDEVYKDYLIWVDKIQRSFYRVMKDSEKGDRVNKIAFFALKTNYILFKEQNVKKHIQSIWKIIEKFNEIVKVEKNSELLKSAKALFGMTCNSAKSYDYEIVRKGNAT